MAELVSSSESFVNTVHGKALPGSLILKLMSWNTTKRTTRIVLMKMKKKAKPDKSR